MPQREPALLWLRDCALTALVLALCTLTSWVFFRLDFVSSNYILTYILGVMYINVFTSGLVYGVVASLFSVMLVNYMFIDPFMQFRIRSDDMVTAVVMLCVSLLCSSLTGRIKVQAAQSERKAYASQVLLEASRSLLGAENPDTILRITATQLGKLLERPVCFAPAPEHIAPGTLILPPPAQTDYRSCPALHEFSTYEHNLALSILDVCSLALEKEASNRARREIEEAARQEQLRANLLRSISHDLRTPLTSISGNALILTEKNPLLTEVNRTRLCGQHKKPPCRILSFKRSGAATAVPLPFLFGCVRGYRSKYTCRSARLLLGASLACGGRCTLFSEWRRNFLPWHCHKDFLSLTWTALCRKIVLA